MAQRVSFIIRLILALDLIRKMAGGDINTRFFVKMCWRNQDSIKIFYQQKTSTLKLSYPNKLFLPHASSLQYFDFIMTLISN